MFYQGTDPPPRQVLLLCTCGIGTITGCYLLQHLTHIKLTLMLVPPTPTEGTSKWLGNSK